MLESGGSGTPAPMSSPVAVPPNRRSGVRQLGNRYSLVKRLAVGGMGEVWEGYDAVLDRAVAVKILRDDLVDAPGFLTRFRAEARHTAGLAHPGIAAVFDYGEDGHDDQCLAYLVMELVDGRPLSQMMAERGPVPSGMAMGLLAQVADALQAAHARGVVHRDVKPGNVLVRPNGTIKVTDFGVARAVDATSITEVGHMVGTARYMSPEQANGSDVGPASDLYSLGVIGYEMLVGHPPFTAENPAALAFAHAHNPPPDLPDNVPAPVRSFIARTLSKDPAQRPADAAAFAEEARLLQPPVEATEANDVPTRIMQAGDPSPTAIMPAGSVRRGDALGVVAEISAERRRRRWVIATAIAAVVVLLIAFAQRGVDDMPSNLSVTSTEPPPSSTIVTAPPTTVAVVTPVAGNGNGSGNGHGKGKGKDKPNG